MDEAKPKSAEQKAQEHTGARLIEMIIAKTYSRHANMTDEEFLKAIGFENGDKTEDEAIRIALVNVLVETTKQLFEAQKSLKFCNDLIKTILAEEKEDEQRELND